MTFAQQLATIRRKLETIEGIVMVPSGSDAAALALERATMRALERPTAVLNNDPGQAEIEAVLAEIEALTAIASDPRVDVAVRFDAQRRLVALGRTRDGLVIEQLELMRAAADGGSPA